MSMYLPKHQCVLNCITVSADDISVLRRCDVYRVLEDARCAKVFDEAIAFIEKNRPDLVDEVAECRAEILEEAQGGSDV